MIEFRYILCHVLLAVVLMYYGKRISRSPKRVYWSLALVPIIAFTIEEGLRWGRDIDWCLYFSVYNDFVQGHSSDHEILFQFIWKAFAVFDLPYPVVIAACSFLLVFSLFYFAKPHKEAIFVFIPFMVFYCAGNATNLIRWYMAFSFMLIALRFYLDGNWKKALVLSVCSACTHVGVVIIFPIFYFLLRFDRIILSPKNAIVISVLLSIFFDPSVMGKFAFIFDFFKGFERFDNYAGDAVGWLTGSGQSAVGERRGVGELLFTSLPLWIFIWVGGKVCIDGKLIKQYNLMVIGIFLRNMASGLQLLGRYAYLFEPFICLMAAYGFIYLSKRRHSPINGIMLCIIIIFFFRKMYMFCAPMEYTEFMHYVWDEQISPTYLRGLYISR